MKIRKVKINKTSDRYCVEFGYVKGRRRRKYYRTLTEARAAIRDHKEDRDACGQVWGQLSPETRIKVVMILQEIERANATLAEVWEFWKVNRAMRQGRMLGDVIREFLTAKAASGVSDRYAYELSNFLSQFKLDRESLDIVDVTPALIEDWLAQRNDSPATRQTGINRLSSLFAFCERRGYLKENPARRVERVRMTESDPQILTVDQCAALVEAARDDSEMLTYLGLALFCGIRPDESKRLTRAEIDLERGRVFLAASKAKVRNRRIIELTAPAKRCIAAGGEVPTLNFRRRFASLRERAKIDKWPHDVLRKTAASHFYNLYGITKATEQLGHSAGVMLRIYRELVTEEQTAAWLAISP